MRFTIVLAGLLLCGLNPTQSAVTQIDSLQRALAKTSEAAEQITICRNLADLTYETPEGCKYLSLLVKKAQNAAQTRAMMEALTDLEQSYILLDKIDSARMIVAQAEKLAPTKERDQWCCYLRMRLFIAELVGEQANDAIEAKTTEFRARDIASESPYQQIEAEFVLGSVLFDKAQYDDALTHMHKALNEAQKLPFREGCPYELLIMRQLSLTNNAKRDPMKAAEINKEAIKIKERYYALYDKAERPFYPMDDFYITSYAKLLINVKNQPDEESRFYLKQLVEMSDRSKRPTHKYSRFLAQYNYSIQKRNIRQSLIYNDSLIHYARQIAVYNLPGLYNLNAILYEMLGDNKQALTNQRESYRLKDSIRENEAQEKFNDLRVEYDLNRLNYEKTQLELHNKLISLIALSAALVALIALCIFLYHHLRRERQRKEHMQRLKLRAEESENLKTVFINSICHEIRTPLNGIVGFAALMLDPSIDEEERQTFPAEIEHNTTQLVSLVDSMLEVANLDVSDEKLPCTNGDLVKICRSAFEKFMTENSKSEIENSLQLPDEPIETLTNRHYLTLVVEHLLDNAYKFTPNGKVTLHCERLTKEVVISISDTGCGIPATKRDVVFERFTKLSTYSPGSGLGLYLCKMIINRLSGRIYIDPDYTPGTRVVVVLPLS